MPMESSTVLLISVSVLWSFLEALEQARPDLSEAEKTSSLYISCSESLLSSRTSCFSSFFFG